MLTVVVPIALLIVLIFAKRVPGVGGDVGKALIAAGAAALLLGGILQPWEWAAAWLDGLDRLSWVMALALAGSIYAETQTEMNTLGLVIQVMRSAFGRSCAGMIAVVIFSIGVAGSLLGDAVASAAVIGILVIGILSEMKLDGDEIAAVITMSAILGSIMPPITQAVFLSASLAGIEPGPVIRISYLTVGIGILLCAGYSIKKFVRISALPKDLIPTERPAELLRGQQGKFVPLMLLIAAVVLYAAWDVDVVRMAAGPFLEWLEQIPVARGLANSIVTFLILAAASAFCCPAVRGNAAGVLKKGFSNAWPGFRVQLGAALLLGAFYRGGQIEAVKEFALSLSPSAVRLGGGFSELLIAALTGSQSTAQNTIFSFFAPVLQQLGVDPVHAAVVGSHIAAGGQAFPPASMTALVVCGLVGGILKQKVNPLHTMILCLPLSVYLVACGFLFMYI